MSRAADRDVAPDAVEWLARLPFLGVAEMSLLMGVEETRAQRVLSELERLGWCEWVVPSSPELEPPRLHVLTETAQSRLADLQRATPLPIGRRETLSRLPRLETTASLNRFLAELTRAATEDVEIDLADARSLPWAAPRARHCCSPQVEAYACLQWNSWFAPAFVAWDRAEAPPAHRRRRVSAWYTYAQSQGWDIPPIMVVCPSDLEAEQWARAVMNSADRRACPLLTVFLSTSPSALIDPLGAIWRRVDGQVGAHLCERLRWIPHDKTPLSSGRLTGGLDLSQLQEPAETLRKWAIRVADHPDSASGFERAAALSLATGPLQKQMLDWLAHHPLLTASDLAVILRVSGRFSARLLDNLARYGLVQSTDKALENEAAPPRRYYLTGAGLKLLAARDGVPPRRYARFGIVAASMPKKQGGGRLETLLRQLDHTVGVNRFFVRLIVDGAKDGPRLVRWLSASEAAQKFRYGESTHWLRPDGAGDIYWQSEVRRFYLEWDRGTMRHALHLVEKFRAYAAFLATRADTDDRPALLVVTVSPHRETVIWNGLRCAFAGQPPAGIFTTIESLVERLGPLAAIWRVADPMRRVCWTESRARIAPDPSGGIAPERG